LKIFRRLKARNLATDAIGDGTVTHLCLEHESNHIIHIYVLTGAAMSAPWSLYHTLNGFDEELDDGDDSQVGQGSFDAGWAC
jgi:hypothetical protein